MRLFSGGQTAKHCAPPALQDALARVDRAEAALQESTERAMAASLLEMNASRNVALVVEAANEAMQVHREVGGDVRAAARAAMRRVGGGHAPDHS
jgi:nucleoside diphosphate kinase